MGGFEVVDPKYAGLYERAVAVLGDHPGVRAVEVGGSVGAGTADAWSDLDLQIVTEPDAYEDVLAGWPDWLPEITPTVFARHLVASFILNTVTTDGLTFDLAVYREVVPEPFVAQGYRVGMIGPGFATVDLALEAAVLEQVRGLGGPFITLLQREEHMFHLAGVPHILGLLTTVFLAELDVAPPRKRWNDVYNDEQRAAVAALPPLSATREGVMGFGLGVAELLVTRARPLYPRYGLEWPSDFAAVVARRVRDQLDLDVSAWLY